MAHAGRTTLTRRAVHACGPHRTLTVLYALRVTISADAAASAGHTLRPTLLSLATPQATFGADLAWLGILPNAAAIGVSLTRLNALWSATSHTGRAAPFTGPDTDPVFADTVNAAIGNAPLPVIAAGLGLDGADTAPIAGSTLPAFRDSHVAQHTRGVFAVKVTGGAAREDDDRQKK